MNNFCCVHTVLNFLRKTREFEEDVIYDRQMLHLIKYFQELDLALSFLEFCGLGEKKSIIICSCQYP